MDQKTITYIAVATSVSILILVGLIVLVGMRLKRTHANDI